MEIRAFLTLCPPVHDVMNAVRRTDLSTLKLGIDPEGQVSLGPSHMNCLSLSLSYLESSLISSTQLCSSWKIETEVGVCVEGKGVKKSEKESDALLRVDFRCFRCVLAMISVSPAGYS